MTHFALNGAISAILDEYLRAINELISVIQSVSDQSLIMIVDQETQNPDCHSIQSILSHVLAAGNSYSVYIEQSLGLQTIRLKSKIFINVDHYIEALNSMFEYCKHIFITNPNITIEENNPSKKINVRWGQQYDIEQLMEHAIVHILRHRRQIELFKISIK